MVATWAAAASLPVSLAENNPGATEAIVTEPETLPEGVPIITCAGPLWTVDGIIALNCVGLTKNRGNAVLTPALSTMVAPTLLKLVGRGTEVADAVPLARLVPYMLTIDPGATGAVPLAADTIARPAAAAFPAAIMVKRKTASENRIARSFEIALAESGGTFNAVVLRRTGYAVEAQEKPIHLPQIPTVDHNRIESTAAALPHTGPTRSGSASATLRMTVNVKSMASSSEIIFTQNAS